MTKRNKYPWKDTKPGDSFFVPGARTGRGQDGVGPIMNTGLGKRTFPDSVWSMRMHTQRGVRGVLVTREK